MIGLFLFYLFMVLFFIPLLFEAPKAALLTVIVIVIYLWLHAK